nr:TipAS antibiotic-recognition domain-containing protein [Skermania sp. ID1734]
MSAKPEWSIQDLSKAAGTTSRTLRHYGEIGLLRPSRVGTNGYRYYDQDCLIRLQRILLLRDLGLGLPAIAQILDGEQEPVAALETHLQLLEQSQARLARQIESVKTTIRKSRGGEPLMATEAFDGFDHTQYKDEVIERWGKEAYESSDRWWRSKSDADKKAFQQAHVDIAADYAQARDAGLPVDDPTVQSIVQRHYDWIVLSWQGQQPSAERFRCLGQMYVDDERFAANYGGRSGAEFVRDAMAVYAERM